jgi:hypothetical protein
MEYLDETQDRIRRYTSAHVNAVIDKRTRRKIEKARKSPEALRARLGQLDREWDVDRAVMLNFAAAGAVTAFNAMSNVRRTGKAGTWGTLFWVQLGFLVNHAVRGWCPPMALLRRLGFRSSSEIGAERVALERERAPA